MGCCTTRPCHWPFLPPCRVTIVALLGTAAPSLVTPDPSPLPPQHAAVVALEREHVAVEVLGDARLPPLGHWATAVGDAGLLHHGGWSSRHHDWSWTIMPSLGVGPSCRPLGLWPPSELIKDQGLHRRLSIPRRSILESSKSNADVHGQAIFSVTAYPYDGATHAAGPRHTGSRFESMPTAPMGHRHYCCWQMTRERLPSPFSRLIILLLFIG